MDAMMIHMHLFGVRGRNAGNFHLMELIVERVRGDSPSRTFVLIGGGKRERERKSIVLEELQTSWNVQNFPSPFVSKIA